MKTFLIFALLAIAATSAIAQMETSRVPGLEKPWQQQPLPPQQQPPFSQQQQPSSQQPPFPQQHQQFPQQQIPVVQPSVLQQLNPCKVFLQQQCSHVAMSQRLARSQMWQQSSCHVMQQQCCQQLPQIPEQSRSEAIRAIVYSIILQEQQQGFVQPQQQQPQQSGQGVSQHQQQSQQQQQLGQCSFQQPQQLQQLGQQPQQQQIPQGIFLQPHQISQLEVMTSIALRTLPTMCGVNVPLYSSTTIMPFSIGTGVGGY
uniref:Low molecular weight glutenin n=1 Tax=Triticum aestivum TaxID=4565 RepID=Q5MFP7_WHEAT|nr:low molecular weight glutenin [Triticum aestivum]AAV92001.1 low molecular weight glutenin [Triticum aestivum]AAV92002.1 low molecular weight glutenin [Triticum aestivum]